MVRRQFPNAPPRYLPNGKSNTAYCRFRYHLVGKREFTKEQLKRKRLADRNYYSKNRACKPELAHRLRIHHARAKMNDKRGWLYFFESITPGFYKLGCTTNWEKRRPKFTGPSTVKRLFFVVRQRKMFFAESMFKIFLEKSGCYKSHTGRGDWYIRTT